MHSLILLAGLARAACTLAAPPDAPFTVALPPDARVTLLIEVHAERADPAWATAIAATLHDRGIRAVFVIDPIAPRAFPGHEIAVAVDPVPGGPDALAAARPQRHTARKLRKAVGVRPRTAWSTLPRTTTEAVLGISGYRVILEDRGPATAVPRVAAAYEAQLSSTLVFSGGPYRGHCGGDPMVAPFTPAAADRATNALRAVAGSRGVVRVALDGAVGSPDDAFVLRRWLDEVILPSGVAVKTPSEARFLLLAEGWDAAAEPAGRFVAMHDVVAAAEALRNVRTLPRTLPGDLAPTEAWLAFALVLAGEVDGDVVQLRGLDGPRVGADSALRGPTPIAREDVIAAARALLSALPDSVPAAVPVGGRLLTAGEILTLFASAVRGDPEPTATPVYSPEPHEAGLGWGRSG